MGYFYQFNILINTNGLVPMYMGQWRYVQPQNDSC